MGETPVGPFGPGPGAGEGGDPGAEALLWEGYPAGDASRTYTYAEGTSFSITLPTAEGGSGSFRYTRSGAMQFGRGLGWNGASRVISGRAILSKPGCTRRLPSFRLTATDTDSGESIVFTVRIVFTPARRIRLGTISARTVERNSSLSLTLPAATGGSGSYAYALRPSGSTRVTPAQVGLTFNRFTRALSATRIRGAVGTYRWTYSATDSGCPTEVASTAFTLRILASRVYTPLRYPRSSIAVNGTQGVSIGRHIIPRDATGGSDTQDYIVTFDDLQNGLVVNTTPTEISITGTPTESGTATGRLRIADRVQTVRTLDVPITVTIQPAARSLAGASFEYRAGQTGISERLPALVGAVGTVTYTVSGNLSRLRRMGFEADARSAARRIYSTRAVTPGTALLTWRARDAADGHTRTSSVSVTVRSRFSWIGSAQPISLTEGRSIGNRTLLRTRGGIGAVRYRTVGAGFPANLTMSAEGVVTGTAGQVDSVQRRTVVVEAYDSVGNTIRYDQPVTISPVPPSRLQWVGVAAVIDVNEGATVSRQLPLTRGGTGTVRYRLRTGFTLSGTGLSLSAEGRITGTARIPAGQQVDLGRNVTVEAYDSATPPVVIGILQRIVIRKVNPALGLNSATLSGIREGQAVTHNLPGLAFGGTPPYTYSLSGLPAGVTSDGTAVVFDGTTLAGIYRATRTVTDSSPEKATASASVTIGISAAPALRWTGTPSVIRGDEGSRVTNHPLPRTTGGVGQVRYRLYTGSTLAGTGLTLSSSGYLSGTLPQVSRTTSWRALVEAYDTLGRTTPNRVEQTIIVRNVSPPLVLDDEDVTQREDYTGSHPLRNTASGGTPPYTYVLTGLPTGVTNPGGPSSLRFDGTRTAVGDYVATRTATDRSRKTVSAAVNIKVIAATVDEFRWNGSIAPVAGNEGDSITAHLPGTSGGSGTVTYRLRSGSTLAGTGLSLAASTGIITGTLAQVGTAGLTRTVTVEAVDSSSPVQVLSGTLRITISNVPPVVTPPALSLDDESVSVQAGSVVNRPLSNRATGGSGSYRYAITGLPAGVTANAAGTLLRFDGSQAAVSTRATRSVADGAGGSATSVLTVVVTAAPPERSDRVTLADCPLDVPSGHTGTEQLTTAAGGSETYSYTIDETLPAGVTAADDGESLTFALSESDTETVFTSNRTATDFSTPAIKSNDSELSVTIRGKLRWYPPARVDATTASTEPVTRRLSTLGGRPPISFAVEAGLPSDSGMSLSVSGSVATVSFATHRTPRVGSYTARIRASDPNGDTADVTLLVVVGTEGDVFRYAESQYEIEVVRGDTVRKAVPLPVDAAGGIANIKVVPALPADLSQPVESADGLWAITGAALRSTPLGATPHEFVATDGAGSITRAGLTLRVLEERTRKVPALCGRLRVVREPRNPREPVPGSTLRDALNAGPIRSFESSALAAAPGAVVTLTWDVATGFRGVPISEVDLYWQDDRAPWCMPGVANFRVEPSRAHEGTRRIRLPSEPGVYTCRLVALRSAWSTDYVSADWWDLQIRVDAEDAAVQVSASRVFVPAGYPVDLQIGFKGASPTGPMSLSTSPVVPEIETPIEEDTPEPGGRVIDPDGDFGGGADDGCWRSAAGVCPAVSK